MLYYGKRHTKSRKNFFIMKGVFKMLTINNNKISREDIQNALTLLTLLENIAYRKLPTDRAMLYCNKVQLIANDIEHINDLISNELVD